MKNLTEFGVTEATLDVRDIRIVRHYVIDCPHCGDEIQSEDADGLIGETIHYCGGRIWVG